MCTSMMKMYGKATMMMTGKTTKTMTGETRSFSRP
jgi:hypothetical protein